MKYSTFLPVLAFLSAGLLIISCSGQKKSIVGRIDGWGDETLHVEYYTLAGEEGRDTLYAENGSFAYTFPLEGVAQISNARTGDYYPRQGGDYMPAAKRINLILFPGDRLRIKGRAKTDALNYTVSGSDYMKDMSRVRSETLPYEIGKDSVEFGLIAAVERNVPVEEQEVFYAWRRVLNEQVREVERSYIRSYPERELSAAFVLQQPLDSFPVYFALLPENVREGSFKTLLDSRKGYYEEYLAYLKTREKEFIGRPAPDFTLTDLQGAPFTLSETGTDKYIVLDFWGSWCGPCLIGMPEMKRHYDRYGEKLEIVGIACRDTEDAWKKTVADLELPWIQVFNDESSPESNVAVLYAVDGYPTKVILAPDKTILAIFSGEGEDFYRKLDELLK